MSWDTIESDPGVFSDLLETLGVKGVTLQELYSLDDAEALPTRVHGLVFLFKWRESGGAAAGGAPAASGAGEGAGAAAAPPDAAPLFMRQVVSNACGTLALLHVALNAPRVALGSTLAEFCDFVGALDAASAGACLEQHDAIRTAHNSFARPEPFLIRKRRARDEDDDVFHFIA
jgi:ubiquitin carboxyl-terminal hydrolase L5